jgi:hypothetical protein
MVDGMVGTPIFSFSFRRGDKVKTLGDEKNVKVADGRSIDLALLFQRLVVLSKSTNFSMLEIMSYELSPFPTSLFSGNDVPRVADKAHLCDAISSFANSKSQDKAVTDTINSSDFFVLDGGSLLHRLPWLKGESFGAIGAMYADFVVKRFGTNNCTVVFDGYLAGPSIKDITHCRRGNRGATVSFTSVSIFFRAKGGFSIQHKEQASLH